MRARVAKSEPSTMSSYTVDLVSSSSFNVYPDNSLASFTNFLPDQLEFEGEWEVALLEISYPAVYNNLSSGTFWYRNADDWSKSKVFGKPFDYGKIKEFHIEPGLYSSVDEILISMNSVLKKVTKINQNNLKWELNPISRKLQMKLTNRSCGFSFGSSDLRTTTGFDSDFYDYPESQNAPYPIDIQRIHSALVYTDIVEYFVLGGTKVPILRYFLFAQNISRESLSVTKTTNCFSFDNLQFRKLLRNSFHSIKIFSIIHLQVAMQSFKTLI